MLPTPLAIGWLLWRQNRTALLALGAWLAAVLTAICLAPPNSALAVWLRIFMYAGLFGLLLVTARSRAGGGLMGKGSGFDPYLFTLPVRTRALVGWQMVYGVGAVALAWLICGALVYVPFDGTSNLWWPAALAAAMAACYQALSWCPFPVPYLRLLLVISVVFALPMASFQLIILSELVPGQGLTPSVVMLRLLALVPLAAVVAVCGVAMTRQGSAWSWALPARLSGGLRANRRPAGLFESALQAQTWLEFKRNALALPVAMMILGAFGAYLSHVQSGSYDLEPVPFTHIVLYSYYFPVFTCLLIGVLLGVCWTCCPNPFETFRADGSLQPYLAARPLTCVQIVLAKVRMAALSVLVAMGVILAILAACLLLPAETHGAHGSAAVEGSIGVLLLPYLSVKTLVGAGAAFALIYLFMLRGQVSSLCFQLLGPRWLNLLLVLPPILAAVVFVWVDEQENPGNAGLQIYRWAVHWLPYIGLILAFAKLFAAAGAFALLRKNNLASAPALARLAGAWLLAVAILSVLLAWLLPQGVVSLWEIVVGVVLIVPIVRVSLAPVALYANRHR